VIAIARKILDDFFIREWGSNRGNVRETGRENNGSVKDRNESVFKEVGWQTQWGRGKGSMVEPIPSHGNLC
jgi:CRISPR/Cas system Type II protein with McrA/HNH and RuvC-like nuclease domain